MLPPRGERRIRVTETRTGREVLDVEASVERALEHATEAARRAGPGVDLTVEFLVNGVLVETLYFKAPTEFTHPNLVGG